MISNYQYTKKILQDIQSTWVTWRAQVYTNACMPSHFKRGTDTLNNGASVLL